MGGVLHAIATIKELKLDDGRDDVNTIKVNVFDGTKASPIRIGTLKAAYDRKAKVVRKGEAGFFTKGPEYNLDPAVDLAALLGESLRAEASAMGFASTASVPAWEVGGTVKDVYLESKQIPYGATLFWGYMDVALELKGPAGQTASAAFRLHNYSGGYNAGMGRKDEAQSALAHLLVEGAQEILSRLNREHFKVPVRPEIEKLAAQLQGGVANREKDLHLVGLSGSPAAVPVLLGLLPKETDENRRSAMIDALARLGSPDAVATLAGRFATEDEDCRFYTIKAMDYIGGDAALALVRDKGTKDPDSSPKRISLRVLGTPGKS
jgi:hypothetical protein